MQGSSGRARRGSGGGRARQGGGGGRTGKAAAAVQGGGDSGQGLWERLSPTGWRWWWDLEERRRTRLDAPYEDAESRRRWWHVR